MPSWAPGRYTSTPLSSSTHPQRKEKNQYRQSLLARTEAHKHGWMQVFIRHLRKTPAFRFTRERSHTVINAGGWGWGALETGRVHSVCRAKSCVISTSTEGSQSHQQTAAYVLHSLPTFATMATSNRRSCWGSFVVLRGGATLGDCMSAFCALYCTTAWRLLFHVSELKWNTWWSA